MSWQQLLCQFGLIQEHRYYFPADVLFSRILLHIFYTRSKSMANLLNVSGLPKVLTHLQWYTEFRMCNVVCAIVKMIQSSEKEMFIVQICLTYQGCQKCLHICNGTQFRMCNVVFSGYAKVSVCLYNLLVEYCELHTRTHTNCQLACHRSRWKATCTPLDAWRKCIHVNMVVIHGS